MDAFYTKGEFASFPRFITPSDRDWNIKYPVRDLNRKLDMDNDRCQGRDRNMVGVYHTTQSGCVLRSKTRSRPGGCVSHHAIFNPRVKEYMK